MKTVNQINLISTIIVTVLSCLLYGLILAVPLGAFQVIIFLVILWNKKLDKQALKNHLWIYGILAGADLLLLGAGLAWIPHVIMFTPIIGMMLAWYHVWIMRRLVAVQEDHTPTQIISVNPA